MQQLSTFVTQYGFPIVAAVGMAYLVFYVWQWATTIVKPVLSEASATLTRICRPKNG